MAKAKSKSFVFEYSTTTATDVIDKIESVASMQGYVASLIRSDLARKAHAALVVGDYRVEPSNISKFAGLVEACFDAFKSAADPEILARVTDLFVPDVAPYVIVAEYLRSTSTDIVLD